MVQALAGLRVVDATTGMAGPLAAMILADYGAEVIRLEPAGGDALWANPAYLVWNRGKKSVDLDLTSGEGIAAAKRLLAGSDALIESLGPGEPDRLGIGYQEVSTLNPSLVYCSISAFGRDGLYSDYPAYDGVVNAKAGRMRDQVGHQSMRPTYRAVNDTSFHTAMFTVQAVLAALRVAWLTGRGQHVETSLLKGTTAPNNPWLRFDGEELPPDRYPAEVDSSAGVLNMALDRREADPLLAIPSQLCTQCKDGRWIMHAHPQLKLFKAWIHTIGFDWIWDDPRYRGAPTSFPSDSNRVELNLQILDRMREKTSQEWIELYRENPDCAGEIMQSTQEAFHHPQFAEDIVTIEDPRVGPMAQVGPLVQMSETPARVGRPAPFPGQHTDEILGDGELGRRALPATGKRPRTPLDGIVVLELATWVASPFAGTLLADLGARVIKVEPLQGDPMRGKFTDRHNSVRVLQGKESISVNLQTVEGREVLHKLVAKADVLFHNYRPGVAERLGMAYEDLEGINPRLVYLHAAGYGSKGPFAQRAAFNPLVGAFSGNSVFQSGEGNPPIGDQSPDPIAGSAVATAVCLGLAARSLTGRGQRLETSMIKSLLYCNSDDAFDYDGKPARHCPDREQLGLEATYGLYETKAGWVFLAVPRDGEFTRFCSLLGREDLTTDPRFSDEAGRYDNRTALRNDIESGLRERSAEEWEALLTAAGLGCVRADGLGYRRFVHLDPHAQQIRLMAPTTHRFFSDRARDGRYWRHSPVATFSATPCDHGKPYTALGEHTIPILEELGYSEAEIKHLTESEIVRTFALASTVPEMSS